MASRAPKRANIVTVRRQGRQWAADKRPVPVLSRALAAAALLAAVLAVLAAWSTPPAPLRGAHQAVVHMLRWTDAHWLNAAAITALGTIAAIIAPFLSRRGHGQRSPGRAAGRQGRERARTLRRIQYRRAREAQRQSPADAARLALGLTRRPDICQLSAATRPRRQQALPLPAGTSIVRLFDEVQGGLLILGAPGAGKTTLLSELASDLMKRAEVHRGEPIPVVLNLSSWAVNRWPLATWLAEELAVNYSVPVPTTSAWVAHDELTVLLDGFDEVAERYRPACAEAINQYRQEHGMALIAVCSRTGAAEELTVRLHMDEAVELLPPTRAQIDRYFRYLEQTGTQLADVRAALDTDEDLQELTRSPLMLHVIALAYHGRPALALRQPGTAEQRRQQLWRAYVNRMFEQRPLDEHHRYSREQAIRWLVWLARHLQQVEQTELRFDQIARSQSSQPANLRRKKIDIGRWLRLGILAADPHLVPREPDHRTLRAKLWDYALERRGLIVFAASAFPVVTFVPALIIAMFGGDKGNTNMLGGMLAFLGTYARTFLVTFSVAAAGGITFLLLSGAIVMVDNLLSRGFRFLKHWGVRGLLVGAGVAPWRYGTFLDAMTERLLLRRSGTGYVFVHALLRDYFADQASVDLHAEGTAVR